MNASATSVEFSLLGGPLHRLGIRLGLVRGERDSVPLGLVISALLWGVLAVLMLIEGLAPQFFTLSAIGGHARLLVVIPLFFLCETLLDPRTASFVDTIVRSGVVPAGQVSKLESVIERTRRWQDSWIPEVICLLVATLVSIFSSQLNLPGATTAIDSSGAVGVASPAGTWYWVVCLPVLRFLIARWIWRLGLWSWFLWRVSRLDLQLVPTHPDGAGGLGYLELVHTHFIPLAVAISVMDASSFAEELALGRTQFEEIYPGLVLVLGVNAFLFLGPLFLFAWKLWTCRVRGLSDYMELASDYVGGFDRKWLRSGNSSGEPLLGTADLQSLADLNNSVTIIQNMRSVPISPRLLSDLALATILPMLPLLLMKFPLDELARKFVERLSGL